MSGVNQMLFTTRAPALSLQKGFGSLGLNWTAQRFFLDLCFDGFALLRIHQEDGGVALCHLSETFKQRFRSHLQFV